METGIVSRRALLAAAASAVGTALPPARALHVCLPETSLWDGEDSKDAAHQVERRRQIYAQTSGIYNVKDYGAKGDGKADDAPAITAAVAAVPAQGGIIYFPPGIYLLNSSVLVHARTDISFVGAGVSATRLQMNADGVTLLSFTGVCSRIAIRDLWLGAVAPYSSGGSVSIVGTSTVHSDTFVIENVRLQNTPAPWFSQYLDNSQVRNLRIMQTLPGAVRTVAILMNNCVSDTFTEVVMFSTAGQFGAEGVLVDYDCDTIMFMNSQVLHAGTYGWRCARTSGHTGPRLCRFTNCYAESCTNAGWMIQAARDVRLSGCHAAVNGGNGFEITGGDSVTVHNSLALENKQHGILVTGGSGIILEANTCSNNSQESNGRYSGIRMDNNVTGTRVVNNRCGDFIFALAQKQKYGISVGSVGTDSLLVMGNDLRGNAIGALDYSHGTNHVITRNLGLPAIGLSAVPVKASPFTYANNDGATEVIYIAGGTVSAVAKNGVTVFTTTPCTVYLQPGDVVTVAYTVAPTVNKDQV